jgi:LDH2 family malate/lactate/ureidoglycolate dehydrogenase
MARLTEQDARVLVAGVFRVAGMRADMAEDAAEMLVLAEMMGIGTHGLARVAPYVDRLRDGGVNPDALPVITAPAPALRQIDGQNGLGAAVALRATNAAIEAASIAGVGAAFCRASSHLGALAPQLLHVAEAGYAAFFTTNTSPMIAPAGGARAVIGNAPVGIVVPDVGGNHALLDMALSVAARSKVRRAAAIGEPIPDTWATDSDGQPTSDAAAAMKGMMQAIGGAKGANLSLCLDLLAGGLSGAAMLSEVPNANIDTHATANVGHLFIVFDAAKLMMPEALSMRLDDARRLVKDSVTPGIASQGVPRLPGTRALAALAHARADGMEITSELLERLQRLAAA